MSYLLKKNQKVHFKTFTSVDQNPGERIESKKTIVEAPI
jgi:hypothetical protein